MLRDTVRLIGEGIRAGSEYPPLRIHAASVATRAPGHKDYVGQLRAIYDDFRDRWRYVRDIHELETVATTGPAIWGLVAGAFNDNPDERGAGDCDDATAYLGAAARAVGFPVRIVTMSKPGATAQSHVYPEMMISEGNWIPLDPVAHPLPFGHAPPAGSRIVWDLYGRTVQKKGGTLPTLARPAPIGATCPDLGGTLAGDCSLSGPPLLRPFFISPKLWKPTGEELPAGRLVVPAGVREAIREDYKEAAAKFAEEEARTAPPVVVVKKKKKRKNPAKKQADTLPIFLLPKSTMTAAAKAPKPNRQQVFILPSKTQGALVAVPPGQRTNLPVFVLPKAVVSAAAKGRSHDMFQYGSHGPAGWLGNLLGYGLTIRLMSFKWMVWKRQLHPWDRWMSDSTKPTEIYWMKKRVEPPPPTAHWGGITPNYCNWINSIRIGSKPFKGIATIPFIDYDRTIHATGDFEKAKWSWGDHPEWGLTTKGYKWFQDVERRAQWTVKKPSWFGSGEEADAEYLARVKGYYFNGMGILWSAAVYAIHARRDRKIPGWFRRHCTLWGLPFPSAELRGKRRYFTESDRFTDRPGDYVAPVSINGLGAGDTITDEDLDQLLRLVVFHTPIPGTVDPVPRPEWSSVCDWPPGTGPMRPVSTMGTPPDWTGVIWARKEKQLAEGWQGTLYDIIPGIVTSIMSIAAAGIGTGISAALSAATGLAGTALGAALSAVVSSAMSLCASSALAFARTGQLDTGLWRQIVSVAAAEAGGFALDQTKGLLGDQVASIEKHTGWQHLGDTWGAGLDYETGTLYDSLDSIGSGGSVRRLAGYLGV